MKTKPWYSYVIETEKGHLYTGITTDIERRFKEHASGKKGAKFFRTTAPLKIIFRKRFKNRSDASKFEARFKSFTRKEKLAFLGIPRKS